MSTQVSTSKLVASQPTKQQLLDYANATIVVNSYAYGITNQSMPVLNYPPKDYASFTTEFVPAKQHALNWSANIFVMMLQLPTTITQQASDLFNLEGTLISAYLNVLISDPSNSVAKKGLATALQVVQKLVQDQIATITQIQSDLQSLAVDIAADAATLSNIATQATQDAKGDQQQILQVQADIAQVQEQISSAQTLLTLSEIGIGVSLFVGLIGVTCCFIPGAQGIGAGIIVLAVAGEAASIAGTVIESKHISDYQKQINLDRAQIKGLDQDIVMLNAVSAQFTALHAANVQAQAALLTISGMWANLDTVIEAVKSELTTVGADNTNEQYQQALTDFQAAEASWAEVIAFATALANIDYNWQDASGNWHNYATQSPTSNSGTVTSDTPSGNTNEVNYAEAA